MADEQYSWLNRETAERLLRGESVGAVGAVDASARDQAERLAGALGALSVPDASADGELPGEAAAMAAFRKAADGRVADAADRSVTDRDPSGDVGVIRIGGPARAAHGRTRSRWRRPVRLGVAAALLLGSVGGAAALAVTGVIPGPFDDADPGPAATVSAAVTPDRGPGSASPDGSATEGSGTPATGGASGGAGGDDPDRDGASTGAGPGAPGKPGGSHGITAACRDLRDGKDLGAGRKRALERAAGGASRVRTYCRGVLQSAGTGTGTSNGNANGGGNANGNADGGGRSSGAGAGNGKGNGNGDAGNGGQGDQGNQNGGGHGGDQSGGDQNGNGGDDEGPIHEGRGRHRGRSAVTPAPAAFGPPECPSAPSPSAPRRTAAPAVPSPDPTYSAL
jgi:hypothetical protein